MIYVCILFLAVLGLCCRTGFSPAAVRWLLIVAPSLWSTG